MVFDLVPNKVPAEDIMHVSFLSAANSIVLIVELTHSSYLKIRSERDKDYEIEAVGKEKDSIF